MVEDYRFNLILNKNSYNTIRPKDKTWNMYMKLETWNLKHVHMAEAFYYSYKHRLPSDKIFRQKNFSWTTKIRLIFATKIFLKRLINVEQKSSSPGFS